MWKTLYEICHWVQFWSHAGQPLLWKLLHWFDLYKSIIVLWATSSHSQHWSSKGSCCSLSICMKQWLIALFSRVFNYSLENVELWRLSSHRRKVFLCFSVAVECGFMQRPRTHAARIISVMTFPHPPSPPPPSYTTIPQNLFRMSCQLSICHPLLHLSPLFRSQSIHPSINLPSLLPPPPPSLLFSC